MIVSELKLDRRSQKKDGSYPVKISFIVNHQRIRIGTDISLTEEGWNEINSIKCSKTYWLQKRLLENKKRLVDEKLAELILSDNLQNLSIKEITDFVLDREVDNFTNEVEQAFEKMIESKVKPRTKGIYKDSLNVLKRYSDISKLRFEDIDYSFLSDLEIKMSSTRGVNGRSVVLRNIRAVLNEATRRGDNKTNKNPFSQFKIKKEETLHRCLSVEEMRKLLHMDLDDQQRKYVDVFFLSFYLLGMNMVDLLHLKRENLHGDRIEYIRSKTGKPFSIKVEPEAMEIIDRYAGGNYLINVMDRYHDYTYFIRNMNDTLQLIGTKHKNGMKRTGKPLFPHLSSYWARHTWATMAADLDINESTISFALGHSMNNRVTAIYIRPNQRKVDIANRKVIDYLKSNRVIEW